MLDAASLTTVLKREQMRAQLSSEQWFDRHSDEEQASASFGIEHNC